MKNISCIGDKCVGCRSCEHVCPVNCITIKPTREGFPYPILDADKCIGCGSCYKSCPAENEEAHRNQPLSAWAFKNNNDEEIMRSASGGAADVACKVILKDNGVVYGAAYADDFVVRHIEVTDNVGRIKLQSSKYVQSDINDCYMRARNRLKEGREVLFTGTPCQIAGLYAFLGGDKPNLFTIDLICHGTPSPKLFKKYLEYMSRKLKGEILYYNFRSKDKRGWGTQYLIKTKTKTKTKTLSFDRYGKHFMNGDCYRECCYQCPFANIKRVGDITVGDFWGVLKSHPDFYSQKGVSTVLINNNKGRTLFEQMKQEADVIPVTVDESLAKQGNLVKPSSRPTSRDTFYKGIDDNDYICKLKVGMQMKERIKSAMPSETVKFLKEHLGGGKDKS